MTAHGFRTLASTLLNEQGWHRDLIELQLAHEERNKVRAAYNRVQRLAERRQMMQAWADYLDGLKKAGGNGVPLRGRRRNRSVRGAVAAGNWRPRACRSLPQVSFSRPAVHRMAADFVGPGHIRIGAVYGRWLVHPTWTWSSAMSSCAG
jgi:hypothetical protein